MEERFGITSFKGNPVTLLGPALKVGDQAPDFRMVDSSLTPVTLGDFSGKTKIICSVPSLDLAVCDTEVRKFNEEATQLSSDVVVLACSMDLPFAQKRWCASAGVDRVKTLSDYQERSFALAYGVLIKELQLLSRSVFVVDRDNTICHIEHVPDLGSEPDYAAALEAAKGGIVIRQVPMDGICGGY
jgi:thioredoxin-dependent peroxiredoxin